MPLFAYIKPKKLSYSLLFCGSKKIFDSFSGGFRYNLVNLTTLIRRRYLVRMTNKSSSY